MRQDGEAGHRLGAAAAIVVALVGPTGARAEERPRIDTLQAIGPAILRCWRPPADAGAFDVTVRLSFRRDGAVLGQPRIVFTRFAAGPAEQRLILRAVIDTLAACTPLPFTDALGGAVAGRPFTLRFTPPSRRA
jgi:hypothetical protein